jgi:hypothetical protein
MIPPTQLIAEGAIFACLNQFDEARRSFNRAIEIGEIVRDYASIGRAGAELERIANVASITEPRTFVWRTSDDSMLSAGLRAGTLLPIPAHYEMARR